jgi:hypothetical protein
MTACGTMGMADLKTETLSSTSLRTDCFPIRPDSLFATNRQLEATQTEILAVTVENEVAAVSKINEGMNHVRCRTAAQKG